MCVFDGFEGFVRFAQRIRLNGHTNANFRARKLTQIDGIVWWWYVPNMRVVVWCLVLLFVPHAMPTPAAWKIEICARAHTTNQCHFATV